MLNATGYELFTIPQRAKLCEIRGRIHYLVTQLDSHDIGPKECPAIFKEILKEKKNLSDYSQAITSDLANRDKEKIREDISKLHHDLDGIDRAKSADQYVNSRKEIEIKEP